MPETSPSFSLIDEPWIPVLYRSGQNTISIKDLFAEAHQIRSIVGDLPTQTFAILRLLLAVLHRSVEGPADSSEWRLLWRSPSLPTEKINDYLNYYRSRFDLLHPVEPFYQVAGLRTAKDDPVGLERLIGDVPNGAPYLTARAGEGLSRLTPAEAARWLVHCQAFDTSGIKSGAVGDPRVKAGKGYPIGTGWCGNLGGVFLEGATLRETLLLNLIPDDFLQLDRPADDIPAWERDPLGPAEEDARLRGPFGPLGLYTWQSRRIRLFGDASAITGALVANGDKIDAADRHRLEPLSGFRRSEAREKELKRTPVYLPTRLDPARSLWRGLEALLPVKVSARRDSGSAHLAPQVTDWLAKARVMGYVESTERVTLRAIGAAYGTQQSVIDQTVDDALTMSAQAFDPDAGMRSLIVGSANDAETAVKAVRALAADLARASGARGDGPAEAGTRTAATAFAILDHEFRRWLAQLVPGVEAAPARTAWQKTLKRTLLRFGGELARDAGPAAWSGRQAGEKSQFICTSLADIRFRRKLDRELPLAAAAKADESLQSNNQEVSA